MQRGCHVHCYLDMDSSADMDIGVVCGLCTSVLPIDEYSEDNLFYCSMLFCDSCIAELFRQVDEESSDQGCFSQQNSAWTNGESKVEEADFEPDKDQEESELEMLFYEWCCEYNNDTEESFDLYEHFGIPSNIPQDKQDTLLEASMGSS